MLRFSVILLLLFGVFACKKAVVTKPSALLRLEYPEASYVNESLDGCPFHFDVNANANVMYRDNCWTNIDYPSMNATIYLTYHPVKRSEEHTSELQSRGHLVCRLLLEKKKA